MFRKKLRNYTRYEIGGNRKKWADFRKKNSPSGKSNSIV